MNYFTFELLCQLLPGGSQPLAVAAPGGVELHKDHVLGHHEVSEGVATQHAHAVILYHQVVSSRGLQGVDI